MDVNKSARPIIVTILDDGTRIWRYKEVREMLAEELREALKTKNDKKHEQI